MPPKAGVSSDEAAVGENGGLTFLTTPEQSHSTVEGMNMGRYAAQSFGLVGGAFASATPTADVPQKLNFAPTQAVTLDEEEMADVRLATFHLFDKENNGSAFQQMAWDCRCGG